MKIQQIRNATVNVYYAGKKLIVDPWFQKKGTGASAPTPWPEKNGIACPTVELPLSVEEIMSHVDAIIATHIHPDHFEPETAAGLDKRIPVFTQNEEDQKAIQKIWGAGSHQNVWDAW